MNTIIELRNKDANNKINPGDWETILPEPLLINPGDSIYIKDSIIDTQQSTNEKINIDEDQTLKFRFGYYRVYNDNTGIDSYSGGGIPVNYEKYTVCQRKAIPNPDPNFTTLIQNIVLTSADGVNNTKAYDNLTITYIDIFGDIQTVKGIACPSVNASDKTEIEFKNLLILGNLTFNPTLDTLSSQFNIKLTPNTETLAGKNVCVPITYTKLMNLSAGNYDPSELCDLINKFMVQVDEEYAFNGVYPTPAQDILTTAGQVMTINQLVKNELVLIPADGNMANALQYDASKNYGAAWTDSFIGTNQFELAYDNNKFYFNYLHMPFYYQKQIAVQVGKGATTPYFINKLGGIWFESLSSIYNSNNKATNFWDLLGFSQSSSIFTKFNYLTVAADPIGGQELFVPITSYEDGINTTGGLSTMDKVIDKDNVLLPWNNEPINSSLSPDEVESIEGGISIFENTDTFGYFLIEVNGNFKNEFYNNKNNYRNIQQIVSRYYVQNSYTLGTSDGSLQYTHSGPPMLLQSFTCRILDSDKNLAQNIGIDNTIHMSIVRGSLDTLNVKQIKDEEKDNKK